MATTELRSSLALPYFALVACLTLSTACATGPQTTSDGGEFGTQPGIYAVQSGNEVTEGELLDRLAEADYVIVGESHGTPAHHAAEATTYEGLVERTDGPVALGMEMFQRPFQEPLDAYVRDEIDERTMLKRTEWEERWGVSPHLYSTLWRTAAENDYPIVALNARRELSRAVAHVGLEGLSDEDKRDVPESMNLSNEEHREYLRQVFEQHTEMSESHFENFYQAQVLWDETMAETAFEFMRRHPNVPKMMIVTGKAHAHRGFGIPPRLERRLEESDAGRDAIRSVMLMSPEEMKQRSLEEIREQEMADFVWVRREQQGV